MMYCDTKSRQMRERLKYKVSYSSATVLHYMHLLYAARPVT